MVLDRRGGEPPPPSTPTLPFPLPALLPRLRVALRRRGGGGPPELERVLDGDAGCAGGGGGGGFMVVLPLPLALEEVDPAAAGAAEACRAGKGGGGGPAVVALDSLSDRLTVLALDRRGNGGGAVAGEVAAAVAGAGAGTGAVLSWIVCSNGVLASAGGETTDAVLGSSVSGEEIVGRRTGS